MAVNIPVVVRGGPTLPDHAASTSSAAAVAVRQPITDLVRWRSIHSQSPEAKYRRGALIGDDVTQRQCREVVLVERKQPVADRRRSPIVVGIVVGIDVCLEFV